MAGLHITGTTGIESIITATIVIMSTTIGTKLM